MCHVQKTQGDLDRTITIKVPEFVMCEGEFVAIVGENGSGKSTLLDMIALLLQPDSMKDFVFHGRDGKTVDMAALTKRENAEVRRRYFAYILQSGGLLEFLTIEQNIQLIKRLKGASSVSTVKLAQLLGIKDILRKRPANVSGGQRQKAAIARALIQEPDLILADEPTSALDSVSAERLMKVFKERVREAGTSLAMVSHDIRLVKSCADRFYHFVVTENTDGKLSSVLVEGLP